MKVFVFLFLTLTVCYVASESFSGDYELEARQAFEQLSSALTRAKREAATGGSNFLCVILQTLLNPIRAIVNAIYNTVTNLLSGLIVAVKQDNPILGSIFGITNWVLGNILELGGNIKGSLDGILNVITCQSGGSSNSTATP